ncbi:putative aldouronate transport system substrate-binding protein [Paenibacillus sp. 1_12]|uniref:extracellular solute-binding protein n=1 Tax=Paenibacillus sp. 1_12 TaxID=1566278 RepID=UPI0008DEF890|nr:extracellular solute-binding protein [Paenibacillus sp. 1_12]SFK99240.1 putative aldouronate transport system substrate-binding protein [Paenibacillus sp. 1_12]
MKLGANTTSKLWKRSIASGCIAVMGVGLLAGCSAGTPQSAAPTDQKSNPTAAAKGPLDLSVLTVYFGAEPPKPDNELIVEYQRLMNVKFNTIWVPSAAYNDKLNTTIAANNMPKALLALDMKAPIIVNSVHSGAFWEIGPLLKDYPNLNKANPIALSNSSIDGKTYGLYRSRPLTRGGIVFRKDWLDNLGLQVPKSLDELYNTLKAFTQGDPDKNGKNDTIGLFLNSDLSFLTMSSWHGAPNKWEVKDNKLSPDFLTKEYFETMKFYKKLFDEKLINQDFGVANNNQMFENINKGKAGMYIGNIGDSQNKHADLYKLTPSAVLDIQNRISGPKGERINSDPGYYGAYMFPKSTVKTEAELKQILAAFDKLASQEGTDLAFYGIKGKHWDLENGKAKRLIDSTAWNNLKADVFAYDISYIKETDPVMTDKDSPLSIKYLQLVDEGSKIVVANPAEALISETNSQKGQSLDKIISDARTKFIMGQLDESGWMKAIEQWRNEGGNKVIEEMSAAYDKTKK